MPSSNGSPGLPDEPMHPLEERALRSQSIPLTPKTRARIAEAFGFPQPDAEVTAGLHASSLTTEEQNRLADGEPYCFRCGKPASSFLMYQDDCVYDVHQENCSCAADYVRSEEGTYNPDTNRFACDGCYIAIGMPAGPDGWRAP